MSLETIGRYRVLSLVGSGGMGDVYEAFDESLQRRVAIKGLRHDRLRSSARERLRREALSTAAISHPAVVTIHEIISEHDTDWVVMEFVEGRSLDCIVGERPLPASEITRIGAEIASALAQAHRHGIIHRDIKTENVMITPAGHVKILDFGLAKWTPARDSTGDRLTQEGLVVGTSRAMSPEQALGREVDFTSDIFSLGSLLYEIATGKAAFSGSTPMDTMVKITRGEYQPLAEVAPELPLPLVETIERCMAMKPENRFESAEALAKQLRQLSRETTHATAAAFQMRTTDVLHPVRKWAVWGVVIVIALAAATFTATKLGWFGGKPWLTVAILPVTTTSEVGTIDLTSAAVLDAITSRLVRLQGVQVISGRETSGVATKGKRATEIARELGAAELVESSFTEDKNRGIARLVISRLNGKTGTVLWTKETEVETRDLLVLEDRISTTISDAFTGYSLARDFSPRIVNERALRLYLDVYSRIESGKYSSGLVEEIAQLERALIQSPDYLEATLELIDLNSFLFASTWQRNYKQRAEELIAGVESRFPKDPRVLRSRIYLEHETGIGEQAMPAARQLTEQRPGDGSSWRLLGLVLGDTKQYGEAEKAFARAFSLRATWQPLNDLASLRIKQGDYSGARQALGELLRRWPDHLGGLSKLAEAEMFAGNHKEAERIYLSLLEKYHLGNLRINLGNCCFYQKKFDEAIALYEAVAKDSPSNPLARANIADALLWAARVDLALANYQQALQLADAKIADGIRVRSVLETRARCLAHLGRRTEAVLAVNDALKNFPNNPETRFVAALVFSISGDTTSCLVWTRQALDANAPKIWFSGPEFAPMKNNPDFMALMSGKNQGEKQSI